MEQKNRSPETLEELKKREGKTCWAYLIAKEKNPTIKIKRRTTDFRVMNDNER